MCVPSHSPAARFGSAGFCISARGIFDFVNPSTSPRTKKRLIAGNWKMYVESPEEARQFALALRRRARGLAGVDIFLAPPFPFIQEVARVLESSPVRVGAQAIAPYSEPAHTGSVSGAMLKGAGASFVIVGHSERRLPTGQAGAAGETNDMVRAQLEQAAALGLTAILCVGEREREADGEHFAFIEAQISSALEGLPPAAVKKLIVAYEPVWAIGKSAADAMKPAELEQMVIFVRKMLADTIGRSAALRTRVLYGGSVEPANAAQLLEESGVNGFLVGHASADVESFVEIIHSCK